jgi:glutathione S-transferase
VRPYLIKKGIDYVEVCPSHPHFMEKIVPTVGYITHPVLETPDGNVIADSVEIMEFLEPEFPDPPTLPEDKSERLLMWRGRRDVTKYWARSNMSRWVPPSNASHFWMT